ncbi:MAG: glutamine--fructose-6-phosphate transaminase (isomerizing), partial [Clostridia bacterium]|nr:glutamine--fructose-6-phosphate transaminase (isomerizing) [Clostridia bacterium]
MCGIVGYIGTRSAVPILIDSLKRLEYRGYDSAGIAALNDRRLRVVKTKGTIEGLERKLAQVNIEAAIGIGHTRWATHGAPSDENAHPHTDCRSRLAVVHNGIIENFGSIKAWLEDRGHVFESETDTEVLPHLIEHFYAGDLVRATRKVAEVAEGSYALAVISEDEPDTLVCMREQSPLVIGIGKGENFIASDIPALLKYTRDFYILEDGELAVITPERIRIYDRQGREVRKNVFHVDWDAEVAEKGGYAHFMLKEIYEQPRALRDTLRGRLGAQGVMLPELGLSPLEASRLRKVAFVACGTAYHAGLVGKYLVEKLARIPAEADIASEFRYREPILDEDTLVVVISQSGETADTLAALRLAKLADARIFAVTNVVGSSVAREAGRVFFTMAGPEIAVASTKAYVTQLLAVTLLAIKLGELRGTLSLGEMEELVGALKLLPARSEEVLAFGDKVAELARRWFASEDVFFIGRGLDYAVALEGALKMKEISYIHAEAYAAGELKHGTLALITEGVPVVALATQRDLVDKMVSNIKEVKARGGLVFAVVGRGIEHMEEVVDEVLVLPEVNPYVAPAL